MKKWFMMIHESCLPVATGAHSPFVVTFPFLLPAPIAIVEGLPFHGSFSSFIFRLSRLIISRLSFIFSKTIVFWIFSPRWFLQKFPCWSFLGTLSLGLGTSFCLSLGLGQSFGHSLGLGTSFCLSLAGFFILGSSFSASDSVAWKVSPPGSAAPSINVGEPDLSELLASLGTTVAPARESSGWATSPCSGPSSAFKPLSGRVSYLPSGGVEGWWWNLNGGVRGTCWNCKGGVWGTCTGGVRGATEADASGSDLIYFPGDSASPSRSARRLATANFTESLKVDMTPSKSMDLFYSVWSQIKGLGSSLHRIEVVQGKQRMFQKYSLTSHPITTVIISLMTVTFWNKQINVQCSQESSILHKSGRTLRTKLPRLISLQWLSQTKWFLYIPVSSNSTTQRQ